MKAMYLCIKRVLIRNLSSKYEAAASSKTILVRLPRLDAEALLQNEQ